MITIVGFAIAFPYLPIYSTPVLLPSIPVIVYRVVGNEVTAHIMLHDEGTVSGYKILQSQLIDSAEFQTVIRGAVESRFSFGGLPAMCFDPGLAFRFGDGPEAVDVIICLECDLAYFYKDGKILAGFPINKIGVRRFRSIYERAFPGRSIDADGESNRAIASELTRTVLDRQTATTSPTPLK